MGGGAYGWLRSEHGVHRLVRISPFDQNHARHTSFARVEIMPETAEAAEVEIADDDIKLDVYRASGNGGQNVQKNSTAVRITHLPTGFVASCQNERSLRRNRDSAMRVLKARLLMLEERKREEERLAIRGDHIEAGWGNQIRSYVLQPYRMVKDLRTQYETSDTDRVLDGDIDEFLKASLQHQIGQDVATRGRGRMRRSGLLLAIAALIALAWPALSLMVAINAQSAEDGPTVQGTRFENSWPDSVIVTALVDDASEVESATFLYVILPEGALTREAAEIVQGDVTRVTAEFPTRDSQLWIPAGADFEWRWEFVYASGETFETEPQLWRYEDHDSIGNRSRKAIWRLSGMMTAAWLSRCSMRAWKRSMKFLRSWAWPGKS